MKTDRYVVIMAGGVGSRFWPVSRNSKPKQFLDILNTGKSLIRLTYERALKIVPPSNVFIITNQAYFELTCQHIPALHESQILVEPSKNNTAPCILYSILHLNSKFQKGVVAVWPSDHIVSMESEFINVSTKAFEFAEKNDAIVTIGINPTRPDTGYGYIRYKTSNEDIKEVITFKEKPNEQTALEYLVSGDYLWNAGIFIWSFDAILSAFRRYANDIYSILTKDISKYGTADEREYINNVYPSTPNISIDFAIIEKASNVYTIPATIGWTDLGTWNSLYNYLKTKDQENVTNTEFINTLNSNGCIVYASDKQKTIIVEGLKDYMVVDKDDVLLIYPRNKEQDIKKLRMNQKDSLK